MNRILKWVGIGLGAVALVVVVAVVWIFVSSSSKVNHVYDIPVQNVAIPQPDSATVAHGEYIARTRGCYHCHGANLAGTLLMDGMPMARVSAPNLTPAGPVAMFSDEDWIRAIRHGIGKDGRSFWVMPSSSYQKLGTEDLGPLVAYLKTLPPVDGVGEIKELGPIGRMLIATGQLPMIADIVDHTKPLPSIPPVGPTVAYGAYVAGMCQGCHGKHFSGGIVEGPPGAPASANLTPHEAGIAGYTEADLFRALREGKKRDGTQMNPEFMPWTATTGMTDVEIQAIWAFLQTLEPRPLGS